LTEALNLLNSKTIRAALNGIHSLLLESPEYTLSELDIIGTVKRIEELQYHDNIEVSRKARNIWSQYYYVPSTIEYQINEQESIKSN